MLPAKRCCFVGKMSLFHEVSIVKTTKTKMGVKNRNGVINITGQIRKQTLANTKGTELFLFFAFFSIRLLYCNCSSFVHTSFYSSNSSFGSTGLVQISFSLLTGALLCSDIKFSLRSFNRRTQLQQSFIN